MTDCDLTGNKTSMDIMDPRAIALGGALVGVCASQWLNNESAGLISAVTVQPKDAGSGGKGTISLVGAGPGV